MVDVTVWWSLTAGDDDLARELLTRVVARHLQCPPTQVEITRLCQSCGSHEHGRPVLVGPPAPRVHLSLTRAPGIVAVALTEAGHVGVDVEEVARTAFPGFPAVALHEQERADTPYERAQVWSRKEAVLKAAGTGLHLDPRSLRVSDAADRPQLLLVPEGVLSGPLWLEDLDLPAAFTGSVAVLAPRTPRVKVKQVARAAAAARRASGAAGPSPARTVRRPS